MTEHVARPRCARRASRPVTPWPHRAVGRVSAVLAALLLGVLTLAVPASAVAAPGAHAAAPTKRADLTPLAVTIGDLSPSVLPARGDVTVTGTVTNRDDVAWSSINVYAFFGADAPIVNSAALARAADSPDDAVVGRRLTGTGQFDTIDSLEPGRSAGFRVTVPASALQVSGPGVYWFGIHALGSSSEQPSDDLTDGRARTFLPYLPDSVTRRRGADRTLPTALVVAITRNIPYADDGSLDAVSSWTHSLSEGGRLRDSVDFGGASPVPLTWLVDPAVVDAVARLGAGNPGRSLAPTTSSTSPSTSPSSPSSSPSSAPGTSPTSPPTSTPTSTPPTSPTSSPTNPFATPSAAAEASSGDGADGEPVAEHGGTSAEDASAANAANAWLRAFRGAVTGDQVLGLPYGDLDVPAALRLDPTLYATAWATKSPELAALGVSTSPVLASPSGYLDADTIAAAKGSSTTPAATVLATDRMFPGPRTGLAGVDGQPVVVTSSGAADAGPGPGPAVTAIGLRQRILAEAAVRLLKRHPAPLTVVLPTDWSLDSSAVFFGGLEDAGWLSLGTVGQLQAQGADGTDSTQGTGATPADVAPDRLDYPALQQRRQLDARTFRDVDTLLASGNLLGGLLTQRSDVLPTLTREALSQASYAARTDQTSARLRLQVADSWVRDRLDAVQISAPRGVTLSSESGKFAATLNNRLDEAVTVGVTAKSDPGLQVSPSRAIEIGPHSHTTVLLDAHATTNKVHNVTLKVTDAEGQALGATDQLPIRSAQVSQVIWVIMGTGVGLLFLAIAARLVRRVRRARR